MAASLSRTLSPAATFAFITILPSAIDHHSYLIIINFIAARYKEKILSNCLMITTKYETKDKNLTVSKIAFYFLLPLAYRLLPVFIYILPVIFP
jgi:hypothetical protein